MTTKHWVILGVAKVVLLALAVGIVFSIYGCNTVRGMGQDIQKAGEVIQRSSQ